MKILILGAGAIGSNLTNRLVADSKGEHEITVLDMDTVEKRNVIAGTQFYMRDQIGMSKVEALQYNIYKFHEKEIQIINKKYENGNIDFKSYDLVIDCFDNHTARKDAQAQRHMDGVLRWSAYSLLHVGFSDQFTFAIEWDTNYKAPDDIKSGMDICEMEGASSFVNYVASVASTVVLEYLKKPVKGRKMIDVVGNKLTHTILR